MVEGGSKSKVNLWPGVEWRSSASFALLATRLACPLQHSFVYFYYYYFFH